MTDASVPFAHLVTRVPAHRNSPRLPRVLELSMTSFGDHEMPAVFLNQTDDLADLHNADDTSVRNLHARSRPTCLTATLSGRWSRPAAALG